MKKYNQNIEVIIPDIFRESQTVDAWFVPKNKEYLHPKGKIKGLNIGFNTNDANRAVEENRKMLISNLGIASNDIAYADQVHGTRIQHITEGGTYAETDGLITRIPGLALAIQVADCGAVLLADEKKNIIAAVHVGWRGAIGNILSNAVETMADLGGDPAHIEAFVSPCISQHHFEVGPEVSEQFPDKFVDTVSFSKPHVDLKGYIANELSESGVPSSQIVVHPGCTYRDKYSFYSYRREQEKSGRMLGIIKLKNG